MRIFMIYNPHKILFGDQMRNEMGGAYGTYGMREECELVRKRERKGPVGRHWYTLEDNIKMVFEK